VDGKKHMKIAGIIGGLGTEITSKFYMEVVFACSKQNGQRPNMLISNVAVPLTVEKEVINGAKNQEDFLPFLTTSARQLEKGGADFIVIPCNTVHIFINEIRKSVHIPVLSIIEKAAEFLKKKQIKEIGLFATKTTIDNRLFDDQLESIGIKIKVPDNLDQNKIGRIIHNLVNNRSSQEDKKKFIKIIHNLKTNNALLACTDLRLLNITLQNIKMIDTMNILKEATVREIIS